MINSETTLEEFIQYIPLLTKDCHLQQVVSAIYSSSQRMIALINDDGTPHGIIYGYLLLDSIREQLLSDRQAGSKTSNIALQETSIALTALPHKTKIQDFFDYFLSQHQEQKQDYWIIDKNKKLLGILNIPKLLQVLCFEKSWQESEQQDSLVTADMLVANSHLEMPSQLFSQNKVTKKKPALTNNTSKQNKIVNSTVAKKVALLSQYDPVLPQNDAALYSILNKVEFPVKVEDIQGNICYQNKYWHYEIGTNKSSLEKLAHKKSVASKNVDVSVEKRQQNNNFDLTNVFADSNSSKKILDQLSNSYCPTVFIDTNKLLTCNELQRQIELFNASIPQHEVSNQQQEAKNSYQAADWYYYKIPLKISNQEIKVTNCPNYWLTFATQFSLEENLNNQKLNTQKQFKLKQLRDEFILNISHDMKSPLTAIIGLSSLLKEEKIGNLNKNQIRYSQMICNSGKRLIDLINDFLSITRLTTEEFDLNLESINIANTCQQIYSQVTKKLAAIAVVQRTEELAFSELQIDVSSNAQFAIADKQVFSHIITCFVENALELAGLEHSVGIKSEFWSNWLAITVWNEGKGLSQAQQHTMFSDSFPSSNFLASPAKMRELGLVLAQQLAQDHGGDISVISQDNYGSQFTLLLPVKDDRSLLYSDSEASPHNCNQNNALVLIVETSAAVIADLNQKLNSLGYQCAIARSQAEALYKARLLQPQKILVNSSFIKSVSEDIVKALKKDSLTHSIPVVLITDINSVNPQQNTTNFSSSKSYDFTILNNLIEESLIFPCSKNTLAKLFTPLIPSFSSSKQNLTVLRLSLTKNTAQAIENLTLDWVFENPSFSLTHHIIEADSLEQADLLARIWNLDVVIWDGATLTSSQEHLKSFSEFDALVSIPIITLNTESTEAANKIANLKVFPCLLPANERSIEQLTEVIQIAAEFV